MRGILSLHKAVDLSLTLPDYKQYSTAELVVLLQTRSAPDLRDGLISLLQHQDHGAGPLTVRATQLMDLPTEIRIRIYALALSDEFLSLPPTTPALLQASGPIRRESQATYYATAQVRQSFTVREDLPTEKVHASTGTRHLWDILNEKRMLPYVRRLDIQMKYVEATRQIWKVRYRINMVPDGKGYTLTFDKSYLYGLETNSPPNDALIQEKVTRAMDAAMVEVIARPIGSK
ncbi:hypothetical protein LTR95_013881 [Oleoguttula sp. CCFEE 5521]